jgi:hypothetical protein
VADILDRELQSVIVDWLARVEQEPDLESIPLNFEERTGHLPHLLHDVIKRLRLAAGTKAPISKAAAEHADLRCKQGYTVAMVVEEFRLLQVTIFQRLKKTIENLAFNMPLPDVATIADEVVAQLKEQMLLHGGGRREAGKGQVASPDQQFRHTCLWRIVTGDQFYRSSRCERSLTFGTHQVAVKRSEPRSTLR